MDTAANLLFIWFFVLSLAKISTGQIDCPPRRLQFVEEGRTCPFVACTSNGHCRGPETCNCDDNCGMSCFNLLGECMQVLSKPDHGIVRMPRVPLTYGVRISFGCEDGYRLSRMDGRKCRSDLKWSGVTPSCLQLCAQPPKPYNGYVVPRKRREWQFESEASYFCNEGYVFKDALRKNTVVRRCGPSGEWSGSQPECTKRQKSAEPEHECESPLQITNGWFELDASGAEASESEAHFIWKPDDVIVYKCKAGFDLERGDRRRVCKWDGGWTGRQPRCVPSVENEKIVYCDSPPNLENGWIEIDKNLGDILQPRPSISPANDDFAPTLIEIRWRVDDVILYRCKSRFELSGGSRRRICKSDGAWTGTQPRCTLKLPSNCRTPADPIGGFVIPRGKDIWRAGDTYSVSCNIWYSPPSPNWTRCLQNGTWSRVALHCEAFCGYPPLITNSWHERMSGSLLNGATWTAGTVFVYFCFPGYEMKIGGGYLTCGVNGRWFGSEITCVERPICSAPETTNGEVVPAEITNWMKGDNFSIKCFPGYDAPSWNQSTCQADGNWIPRSLNCTAMVRCRNPTAYYGTVVPQRKYTWYSGDTFTIRCFTGFIPLSANLSKCMSNGSWSPSELACRRPSYCPLSKIENGWVERKGLLGAGPGGRWMEGVAIMYRCNDGFVLEGESKRRVCTVDGTWTGTQPTCRAIRTEYCPPLPRVENGFIEHDRNAGHSDASPTFHHQDNPQQQAVLIRWVKGDAVRHRCRDGYKLDGGSERRICTEERVWSGSRPRCVIKESGGYCPSPPAIVNGFIENDRNTGPAPDHQGNPQQMPAVDHPVTRWVRDDVIRYRCISGYKLVGGSDRKVCTEEGTWTGTQLLCTRPGSTEWRTMSNRVSYAVTTKAGSFSEVIAGCMDVGGKLVGESIARGNILRELLGHSGIARIGQSFWIGLNDRQFEQNWKWLDGTRMDWNELWKWFNTNEILFGYQKDCAVVVSNEEKWRAENCDNQHFAICEREPFEEEHRSAVDETPLTFPTFDEDAFVAIPILIQENDTSSGDFEIADCRANPCLNGCECEESGLYGYFCKAVGSEQYLGSNCEYDPPRIECGHDVIEIALSVDYIRGMDGDRGDGVAYLAPDEELARDLGGVSEKCRFTSAAGDYRVYIPFPFDSCGTFAISRHEGGISFGNTIWYSRDLASGMDISVHSSVAEISCTYGDVYRVTSVIDSICCPTPPIITANGMFMFETTVWADPPDINGSSILLGGRNRARADVSENGFISYRVGEMLYLKTEMKSRYEASESLIPSFKICWMSPDVDSRDPRPDKDLILHPSSDFRLVNTYGPVNTGLSVHFGFQLLRAKESAVLYLHCQVQVLRKRSRRSLNNGENVEIWDVSVLTKGPIVVVNPHSSLDPARDESAMKEIVAEDEATNRMILGISFFGVAAIAVVFGCCVAHLRSIYARQYRSGLHGSGYLRQRMLSSGHRGVNTIHAVT